MAKTARNANRRTVRPRAKIVWISRLSTIGSWLCIVIASIWLLYGGYRLYHKQTGQPVNLAITGSLTPSELTFVRQQVSPILHRNLFGQSLAELIAKTKQISWIYHASATRHWPNTIVLTINKQLPVARWGGTRLMNREGRVYQTLSFESHPELPILYGPSENAASVLSVYQNTNQWLRPLGLNVREIYLSSRLTCTIHLNNHMQLIVDNDKPLEKIEEFSRLMTSQMQSFLPYIIRADLRYRNGFALQWKQGFKPNIISGKLVQ